MDECVQNFDVVAPETYQKDCSYVHQLSRPTFDFVTQKCRMVGSYTDDLKNNNILASMMCFN